jgi:hypothetical protein
MASLDISAFDFALKEWYTTHKVESMVYKDNPLLAMMAKYETFKGDKLPVPVIYSNPQGRSSAFATAQTNTKATKGVKFELIRKKDYGVAHIDGETILASASDPGSFLRATTTEIDGIINSITRSLATAMYGSGSGSIGKIANSSPTTSLTLADTEDITNFEVGMVLVLSTADGGGTVKTGTTEITDVNRDTGVITVATDVSGFTPAGAQNDFIFVEGDYDAKITGLAGWLPATAPSATTFFGVDRTSDVTRLGGIRFDGTSKPIDEALVEAASRAARDGGTPDHCFMSFDNFAQLENALGPQKRYQDIEGPAGVGFTGMKIKGPKKEILVVPDQNCPGNVAYMMQLDMWKLYSLGKAPRVLDLDSLSMLRRGAADEYEVRYGYYAQMGCRAPGYNVRVALTT